MGDDDRFIFLLLINEARKEAFTSCDKPGPVSARICRGKSSSWCIVVGGHLVPEIYWTRNPRKTSETCALIKYTRWTGPVRRCYELISISPEAFSSRIPCLGRVQRSLNTDKEAGESGALSSIGSSQVGRSIILSAWGVAVLRGAQPQR